MTRLAVIIITIAFSFYWPAWGGVNGSPHGNVASGDKWQEWAYTGAACPADWPFGTRIVLDGTTYTCVDRGSAVGYDRRGLAIIDFLTDTPAYLFKQAVTVQILPPLEVTQAAMVALNEQLRDKID